MLASAANFKDVGQRIGGALEAMPFYVVGNEERRHKASAEIMSEALALAYLREVLLEPADLIRIIVATADRTPDGRRALINPTKALAAAAAR